MSKVKSDVFPPADHVFTDADTAHFHIFRFDRCRLKIKFQTARRFQQQRSVYQIQVESNRFVLMHDLQSFCLVAQMPAAARIGSAHQPHIIAAAPEIRPFNGIHMEHAVSGSEQILLLCDGKTIVETGDVFTFHRDFQCQGTERFPSGADVHSKPEQSVKFRADNHLDGNFPVCGD